jgi:hypothetical protein
LFNASAIVRALVVSSTNPSEIPFPVPFALIATTEPLIVTAPVVFPAVNVLAAFDAKVVFPEEPRVVKLAVDGVVAPIAVELIPVAVVLKLPEVMVKLVTPVSIDEALNPDRARDPEVAVKLRAPVVW